MENKTFVVIRSDLDPGLQLAQTVHAAIAFTATHGVLSDNVVVLSIYNEQALSGLLARAAEAGHRVASFSEPDLGGELTSAAFGPEARRLLSSLPLAGRLS